MLDLDAAATLLQQGSIDEACRGFSQLRDPHAIPLLLRAFFHQTDAQQHSDLILATLESLSASDALRQIAQDPSIPASRRYAAFICLCNLPDPQSLPLLRRSLEHPHPSTRLLAIRTLGLWRATEAAPDLIALAHRTLQTSLRRDIFASLAFLPCFASLHFFQTLLLSGDPALLRDLLSALGSAPPSLDLLELLEGLQTHFAPHSPAHNLFTQTLASLRDAAKKASASSLQEAAKAAESALFE